MGCSSSTLSSNPINDGLMKNWRRERIVKNHRKIILLGFDNAGVSSLRRFLFFKYGCGELGTVSVTSDRVDNSTALADAAGSDQALDPLPTKEKNDSKSNRKNNFVESSLWINKAPTKEAEYFWDLGGSNSLRPLWRHHYSGTQGIIFVLDVYDSERFPVIKEELYQLLDDDQLADSPFLLLLNIKNHIENNLSQEMLERVQTECGYKNYPNWGSRPHEARVLNLHNENGQNSFTNEDLRWLIETTKSL